MAWGLTLYSPTFIKSNVEKTPSSGSKWLVVITVVSSVILQRVGIKDVPVLMLVFPLLLIIWIATGKATVRRFSFPYLLMIILLSIQPFYWLAIGWLEGARQILLLGLLGLCWFPLICLHIGDSYIAFARRVFVAVTAVGAVIAIFQVLLQFTAFGYFDLLKWLIGEYLLSNYLDTAPIGSAGETTGIFRANG